MKKALFIALALVAGASSFTANAVKKKMVMAPVQEKVEPVVLASSSDSVSDQRTRTLPASAEDGYHVDE